LSTTHTRTEGRAPVRGSEFTTKAATLQGGVNSNGAQLLFIWALAQLLSCYPRPRLIQKVLGRGAQALARGGTRCASQVLDRGA
jgi:hypothetical protein